MEKEIYTDNEKQLLELTKFFIEYFNNFPTWNEEEKKAKEASLKYYLEIEKDIIHFANERCQEIEAAEGSERSKWTTYHDVTCQYCKFFTALKPIKEEKAKNGFTYFIYCCPKCNKKFHGNFPNSDIERLNYTKYVYDYFIAKGKDGRINHVRLGISKEDVNGFLDMHLKLKEAFIELEKSIANDKIRHQAFADMVANEITGLAKLKQQYLSSEKNIGNGGDIN